MQSNEIKIEVRIHGLYILSNYVSNIEHLPGLIEADVLNSFKILCRRLERVTDNAGKPKGANVSAEKLRLPEQNFQKLYMSHGTNWWIHWNIAGQFPCLLFTYLVCALSLGKKNYGWLGRKSILYFIRIHKQTTMMSLRYLALAGISTNFLPSIIINMLLKQFYYLIQQFNALQLLANLLSRLNMQQLIEFGKCI